MVVIAMNVIASGTFSKHFNVDFTFFSILERLKCALNYVFVIKIHEEHIYSNSKWVIEL